MMNAEDLVEICARTFRAYGKGSGLLQPFTAYVLVTQRAATIVSVGDWVSPNHHETPRRFGIVAFNRFSIALADRNPDAQKLLGAVRGYLNGEANG